MRTSPRAEILTIGNELLSGAVLNTNGAYLGKELTSLGFEVQRQSACPDEAKSICLALATALDRSEVVMVSGGLGPTPDDVTRESIAEFYRVPLVLSQAQYRKIQKYYRYRKRPVPAIVKREACFPANAKPLLNRFGVALGFKIEEGGKTLVVLPGVPGELTRLFDSQVRTYLRRKFIRLRSPVRLTVKTIGVSEPYIMERLSKSFFRLGKFQFGIYPEAGEVTLRIYTEGSRLRQRLKKRIEQVLSAHVYSFSEEGIEAVIARKLRRRHGSLAIAESCTGGGVSQRITRLPGASRFFRGGVVAYENRIKIEALGVSKETLTRRGAVSKETAAAMARGVRNRFESTLGLSVTGIAGPGGGSPAKPVGLVYVSIASSNDSRTWQERFLGDREQIQERAVKKALEHLWTWLKR